MFQPYAPACFGSLREHKGGRKAAELIPAGNDGSDQYAEYGDRSHPCNYVPMYRGGNRRQYIHHPVSGINGCGKNPEANGKTQDAANNRSKEAEKHKLQQNIDIGKPQGFQGSYLLTLFLGPCALIRYSYYLMLVLPVLLGALTCGKEKENHE